MRNLRRLLILLIFVCCGVGLRAQTTSQGSVVINAIQGKAEFSTNQLDWLPLHKYSKLSAPFSIRTLADSGIAISLNSDKGSLQLQSNAKLDCKTLSIYETNSESALHAYFDLKYGFVVAETHQHSAQLRSDIVITFPDGVAGSLGGTFALRVFAPSDTGTDVKISSIAGTVVVTKGGGSEVKTEVVEAGMTWDIFNGLSSMTILEREKFNAYAQVSSTYQPQASQRGGHFNSPPKIPSNPRIIKVFYGTDRNETGDTKAANFYGAVRDEHTDLKYGVTFVNIPPDHKMAELESPSWLLLEFEADPQKHVILERVHPMETNKFFISLSNAVSHAERKDILIFIHGFSNTFEDTAQRTGQLAYDLGFKGVPMFFSWTSLGDPTPLGYTKDLASADFAVPYLQTFLECVSQKAHAEHIYVIAHSMGNRVLSLALEKMDLRNEGLPMFKEIVLAAPDVDAAQFKSQLAEPVKHMGQHITLYASSHDKALKLSEKAQGYPRAGDIGKSIVISPPMDTVDVSSVNSDFLGHSYYGDNTSVISDLILILEGKTPQDRKLVKETFVNDVYWKFKK
jgi:esterase/lipase superfamily enzyme